MDSSSSDMESDDEEPPSQSSATVAGSSAAERTRKESESYDVQSELNAAGDDMDDSIEKNQMVIDSKGGFFRCDALNLSLEVPENSIDHKVQLKISSTNTSNVPPISCDFGEMILSDAILLEPMGIEFRKPAVLSIDHSIVELPKLTSIVIKCYDHENKEWITLPTGTDQAKEKLRVASGEISRASIFAVCLSLDLVTYTVTKYGSSFEPFGSQYHVKVTIEENTFGEDNAILEFKMNVFSETAVGELSRFGLKPFPILHVKEKTEKQPLKPITIKLPINEQIQSDEKLVVLCADSDGITNLKQLTCEIGKQFLTVHLDHFTILPGFVQKVGEFYDIIKVFQWLWLYAGTRHSVEFITYRSLLLSPVETFYIGCCEQHKLEDLHKSMKDLNYVPINLSQEELYSGTEMTIKLDHPHAIINEPLKLKFINNNCNHTDEFEITVDEGSSQNIEFMIYKLGADSHFKTIRCLMNPKEVLRELGKADSGAREEDARIINIYGGIQQIGDGNFQQIGGNPLQQSLGGFDNPNNLELTSAPSAAQIEGATGSGEQLQTQSSASIPSDNRERTIKSEHEKK